jgi:hypothetical protein
MKLLIYMLGMATLFITTAHAIIKNPFEQSSGLIPAVGSLILEEQAKQIAETRAKIAQAKSKTALLKAQNQRETEEIDGLARRIGQREEENKRLREASALLLRQEQQSNQILQQQRTAQAQRPVTTNRPWWQSWSSFSSSVRSFFNNYFRRSNR